MADFLFPLEVLILAVARNKITQPNSKDKPQMTIKKQANAQLSINRSNNFIPQLFRLSNDLKLPVTYSVFKSETNVRNILNYCQIKV